MSCGYVGASVEQALGEAPAKVGDKTINGDHWLFPGSAWVGEGLTTETELGASDGPKPASSTISPTLAALMAGITAFSWAEAIIRFLATNATLLNLTFILPERVGDVVAIWAAALLVGLAVFVAAYFLFRRRRGLGSIRAWTMILLVSLILRYL